ncbi:P-loop containing nucleoside triphosphate hydrolase protein [Jackrogersella minutella]|nr:P-loop containing nucleoside triphosphate hydrolase protein [Jackrogersella minutella]
MEVISLDAIALEQLHGEQKALLDAIDDLRKHGIGRFVDLPQIIVVGDQSSGKSSVLEAISRVRFPVQDGLCTRFATELVLRTSNQTKVDVRIQPSANSKNEAHSFDENSFNKEELPRLIEEAKKRMLEGDAGFSEDVLRIEISSPDVPHLTMVDLPGFYHSEDENQSAAGREIVDRLVERYMARKNSIILAIISARNQVILQKVLSKVKHHDKQKERTLGIITKPDILTPDSQDEANFIRLAKNLDRSHELSLGWHVLRNRGETEVSDTDEERDEKERKFFESSCWSGVPSSNRGVESLRKKLSGILLGHIKDNIQGLIESIEENINDHMTRLKRLGEPRSTPKELRTHLDKIASQFHILCLQALEGNYADQFFGGLYPENEATAVNDTKVKKLRALVRDLNRTFTYVLETKGSRRIILPRASTAPESNFHALLASDHKEDELGSVRPKPTLPTFLRPLAKLYKFEAPVKVSFEEIASSLESLSSANQGNEFPGTSNDRLAVKLFQDQSRPWEEIARCHIKLVLSMTQAFVEKLMGHIVNPDKRTCSAILSKIVDPFFETKSTVLESKLQELLYHYKSGHPQPLDTEFRVLLAEKRRKNVGADVIRAIMASRPELFTDEARTELEQMTSSEPASEFGVDGLIDKSEIYYEMSLRTFTDNMIVLAVENCLIRDLPSIFSTDRVNQMEDDELERLSSESPEIQTERKELQAEYDALKKGLQICNKFKERKVTTVTSIFIEPDSPSTTSGSGNKKAKPVPNLFKDVNTPLTTSTTPGKAPSQGGLFSTINPQSHVPSPSSTGGVTPGTSSSSSTPQGSFFAAKPASGSSNGTTTLGTGFGTPPVFAKVNPSNTGTFGSFPSTNVTQPTTGSSFFSNSGASNNAGSLFGQTSNSSAGSSLFSKNGKSGPAWFSTQPKK